MKQTEADDSRILGKWFVIIAWLIAISLIAWFFNGLLEQQYNPNKKLETHSDNGIKEVVLKQNHQRHYVFYGKINDQKVKFVVDTGATVVAIPGKLAKKLHLKQGAPTYAQTAGGRVTTYDTQVSKLEIGPIVLYDIRGTITPDFSGNYVLLGMNVLSKLELTQKDGLLILRQNAAIN